MKQYDEIELINPCELFNNGKSLLSIDEFKLFVSKCINLECTNLRGKQLIHYANNLELIKCLVEKGVDVNCADKNGWHPINYACIRNDNTLEIVKYLVENGADIE